MKPFFLKTTLCALLLAATVSGVSAQMKKVSSLSPVARAGLGISSSFNPFISVGLGLGSQANYNKTNFSVSGDVGVFIGNIPLRKYYKEFPINKNVNNSTYSVECLTTPIIQPTFLISYGSFSFGGGFITVKKSGNSLESPYAIPDAGIEYNKMVFGYSLKAGVKLTRSLHLEAILNEIPKTKELPEKINDKRISSFSLGITKEFQKDKHGALKCQ